MYDIYSTSSIPLHLEEAASACLKQANEDKIVEKVPGGDNSEFCFRGFFVPKPGSSAVRLVADMAPLNLLTDRASYTFKTAQEILQSLPPGCTNFASADAING